MRRFFSGTFLIFILLNLYLLSFGKSKTDISFSDKKEITIVITDSGLGGLTVMDDIAKKISKSGHYKKVNLIFVNALFDENRGYNALSTREERINIFNNVLYGIEDNFAPDIILVACNTLSVIYAETEFVKKGIKQVEGIVQPGVRLIYENLSENEKAKVIITGTESTIAENSHRASLIQKGISEDRIIVKACPQLQSYIEQDPEGEDTEMLISFYMEEVVSQMGTTKIPVYLSLNCTHFAYSENFWKQAFGNSNVILAKILNPNSIMGDMLLPEEQQGKYRKTKLTYSVVSKVKLKNKESMIRVFREDAPELTKTLDNYYLMPDLF